MSRGNGLNDSPASTPTPAQVREAQALRIKRRQQAAWQWALTHTAESAQREFDLAIYTAEVQARMH